MLTALDESFLHQSPVTFDQTHLSDHRFFDRIWLGGCNPDGIRVLMGLASYKNTNTFDGYLCLLKDGKQYNLRASRPFLPDPAAMKVGPLSVEVVKPLQVLRARVDGGISNRLRADFNFTGTIPAREEAQHVRRVDGKLVQDYRRFDQIGKLNGWFEIDGVRVEMVDWWGGRDHSWGIRPGMGGYEPATSVPLAGLNAYPGDISAGYEGFMIVWLAFEAGQYSGYLQQLESGDGKVIYTDGHILVRKGEGFYERAVKGIQHELTFIAGTRVCDTGILKVTLDNGEVINMNLKPHIPPTVYKGAGYDSGFFDERGLGLHRGTIEEFDVYDISHPENVILEDGRLIRPWHREASCTLTVNGERGMGHFPIISTGPIKRYGLYGEIINRKG
jgi:hypothetical protein